MSMSSHSQRSDLCATPDCPRHPGVCSADYCKHCNRLICVDYAVPTEVCSIYVDHTFSKKRWMGSASRTAAISTLAVTCAMMTTRVLMYIVTLLAPTAKPSLVPVPVWLMARPQMTLTDASLHGGIMHILFSTLSLYWVGRVVESILGRRCFLTLYLASTLDDSASILVWCLIQSPEIFVNIAGVPGAVFSLSGIVFVLQRLDGLDTTAILTLLGINPVYGFTVSGTSWQGHVGGVIVDVGTTQVLVYVVHPRPDVMQVHQNRHETVVTLGMITDVLVLDVLASRILYEVYGV